MPNLTVIQNDIQAEIIFSGRPLLGDLLAENGFAVAAPCGGTGKCGKCKVLISGDVSDANEKEIKAGFRLACQTVLQGDCTVTLLNNQENFENIQTETTDITFDKRDRDWKYGIAIDIGTTTIVAKLYSSKGTLLSEASAVNPQRSISADVMGRIDAAINQKGEFLKNQIKGCIERIISTICEKAGISSNEIDRKIITGNTAMLYLYTGISPKSIATAPFCSETLFGKWDGNEYLPHCMNAFVGADITCGILATKGCESDKPFLLCDIGTNGEIALWKNKRLYIASTAAGPAFEGAEISCGCGSINGAIDRVWEDNGRIKAHTIGNEKAVGICGSGLIDAIAVFLKLGYINKSGEVNRPLILSANGGNIELTPEDICAVQLAKAAVSAGIETVLKYSETNIDEIEIFYIAGGFGNNLSLENAAEIGLIPKDLTKKSKFIGNSALAGAVMMLFDDAEIEKSRFIAKSSMHIELGGNEDFNSAYITNMMF